MTEGVSLEFRAKSYGRSDADVKEFLKDASFLQTHMEATESLQGEYQPWVSVEPHGTTWNQFFKKDKGL